MDKIIAIYDSDLTYATRFMEYFRKRKEYDFEVSVFTQKESLEEFLKEHNIEIMLLGDTVSLEEITTENIRSIYRLSDHSTSDKITDYPCILKYQAVNQLLAEVLTDYKRKESISEEVQKSSDTRLISIFSAIPTYSKIVFAWSLSFILASKKKVLFIPLEILPVKLLSLEENANQSLSEFIYYLKENNPNIIVKMKTLLNYKSNLSYLSGISHGFDLLSISKDDMCKWIEELKKNTDYQTIVFYVAYYADSAIELLNLSDTVLLPVTDHLYDTCIEKEWIRQIKLAGYTWDQKKLQRLLIDEEEDLNGKEMPLQELENSKVWLNAMQYARTFMEEQ